MLQVDLDRKTMAIRVVLPNGEKMSIGKDEVQISHFSHGKGGQNVNRHLNGVQLIYRIPEALRRHARKTQQLLVRAGQERSLERNMIQAFEQMREIIFRYFYIAPTRFPTKIGKGVKKRRMQEKQLHSLKKRRRQLNHYDQG